MKKEIYPLLMKEFRLEFRNKLSVFGYGLFVLCTIFIAYLAFLKKIDPYTWNALLWIILVFSCIHSVTRSFIQENSARRIYYYTLCSPQGVILAKMIYNMVLMSVLALLTLLFYTIYCGNPVENMGLFIACLCLGNLAFSSVLTMVSAIASKTGQAAGLMAVMSIPLLLPLVLTCIKCSFNALIGLGWDLNLKYLIILFFMNLMVVSLAYMLFPYLWRD